MEMQIAEQTRLASSLILQDMKSQLIKNVLQAMDIGCIIIFMDGSVFILMVLILIGNLTGKEMTILDIILQL